VAALQFICKYLIGYGFQDRRGREGHTYGAHWVLRVVTISWHLTGVYCVTILKKLSEVKLQRYRYKLKAVSVKLMIITVKLQSGILDIIGNSGGYPCLGPTMSERAYKFTLRNSMVIFESLLGSLLTWLCFRVPESLPECGCPPSPSPPRGSNGALDALSVENEALDSKPFLSAAAEHGNDTMELREKQTTETLTVDETRKDSVQEKKSPCAGGDEFARMQKEQPLETATASEAVLDVDEKKQHSSTKSIQDATESVQKTQLTEAETNSKECIETSRENRWPETTCGEAAESDHLLHDRQAPEPLTRAEDIIGGNESLHVKFDHETPEISQKLDLTQENGMIPAQTSPSNKLSCDVIQSHLMNVENSCSESNGDTKNIPSYDMAKAESSILQLSSSTPGTEVDAEKGADQLSISEPAPEHSITAFESRSDCMALNIKLEKLDNT